jgi:azurin
MATTAPTCASACCRASTRRTRTTRSTASCSVPGGSLYFQEGTFHHTGVETPWGPAVRSFNAGVFRYEPRTRRFEVYAAYGFANPHGHAFDRWGQDFVTDGTGAVPYWGTAISVHVEHPRKVGGAPQVYRQRTRPCGGTAILSSAHFPDELQGNWLVTNVIGFLGVLQYRFADDGAGFKATEVEPLLSSTDPNFRPVDVEIGGDGAVYVADWQNPIIGHMQHNLRDPSRDRLHGRVYRVSCKERPRLAPAPNATLAEAALVAQLGERDDPVRYRARLELSGRPREKVLAALAAWQAAIPADGSEREHLLLEALWLQQQCGAVDRAHLQRMLRSPEPRARAAATRVLCELRHELPDALEGVALMAADADARVRVEAVRACSFFASARAAELALRAASQPLDRYSRYVLRETLLTLRPHWTAAIRAGEPFAKDDAAGLAWLLEMVDAQDLARLPRTEAVCRALLTRAGVSASERRSALDALAQQRGQSALGELLTAVRAAGPNAPGAVDLAKLLVGWAPQELRAQTAELQTLARDSQVSDVRAAAYGAWLRASETPAPVWDAASASLTGLGELLRGVALGGDLPASDLWARIRPLMFEVPEPLRGSAAGSAGVGYALYEARGFADVRRETLAALTPKAIGTLAKFGHEVAELSSEPYALLLTATINVPVAGKYVFYTASDDGSRLFVDDRQVVANDGPHGVVEKQGSIELQAGAHPIVVTYYDAGGDDHLRVSWSGPGFAKQEIPTTALSVDGSLALRRAAIAAAARVPGAPATKFADLAQLVRSEPVRGAAIDALLQLPCATMPVAVASPLARELLAMATATAATDRETAAWQRTVQLAEQVAAALPAAEAAPVTAGLAAINPQVVTLRTVREKMRYDLEEFTVTAGRPVRLVLHNPDGMQHNLLIVAPGALEAIGGLADTMGADGFAKGFVPADPRVLHSVRLLNPGETATLEFTAPATPGDYPYVCTFPGHWRLMRGVMHVRG